MASAIIHICVAKKINEKLKRNEKRLFLGTIAPDISKQIGETKIKSHFLENTRKDNVPVLTDFLRKYQNELNNDFELGYYIHLYTDKIWFEEFMPTLTCANTVRLLDGTILKTSGQEMTRLIYNDYTNINVSLLDAYDLNLSLFYEEIEYPITKLNEIPIDKLNIIVDKMGIIIENSSEETSYIFDIEMIRNFIDDCSNIILDNLRELGIY